MTVPASFRSCQVSLNLAKLGIAIQYELDSRAGVCDGFLGYMGDYPVRREAQVALVSLQLAANQGEQAGLACAIGARDTHFLSGMDLKTHPFEQDSRTTSQANVIEVQHGGGFYMGWERFAGRGEP